MRTDDHLELLALAPRYAMAVDARDLAGATALFSHDGVLRVAAPPGAAASVVEHHGHDAIGTALAEVASVELTVHEIVGQVVEPGPAADQARGRVRCVAHHVTGEQDVVWHLHYDDSYTRTSDGWRIARRILTVDLVEIRRVRPRTLATPSEAS